MLWSIAQFTKGQYLTFTIKLGVSNELQSTIQLWCIIILTQKIAAIIAPLNCSDAESIVIPTCVAKSIVSP